MPYLPRSALNLYISCSQVIWVKGMVTMTAICPSHIENIRIGSYSSIFSLCESVLSSIQCCFKKASFTRSYILKIDTEYNGLLLTFLFFKLLWYLSLKLTIYLKVIKPPLHIVFQFQNQSTISKTVFCQYILKYVLGVQFLYSYCHVADFDLVGG